MAWIAITGGCGYIGSHIASVLRGKTDHNILLIDRNASNLRHTHHLADRILDRDFASEQSLMELDAIKPMAIIHCGGTSLVGPSMTDPSEYYHNNVVKTLRLLDWLRQNPTVRLVFSSSSSIYGDTHDGVCHESTPTEPISPYAKTKLMIEQMLEDYYHAYGVSSLSLRYFNAAGGDGISGIGQLPNATHLIAAVCEHMLYGRPLEVYGDGYPTKDGTAIRDYTHVIDIANAHLLGLNWLMDNHGAHAFNLGTGTGSTVLEVIAAAQRCAGRSVTPIMAPSRPGDPARRIATNYKAADILGWKPERDLDAIVSSALEWYNSETYRQLRFANR